MKSREQIEKMYWELEDQIKWLERDFKSETVTCYKEEIQRELSEVRGKASLLREILDG